jgi:hypothetical protein
MRPKGTIRRVAAARRIDQATVRRAVFTAGLDPNTVSFEQASQSAAVEIGPARFIGHAANGRGEGEHTATDTLSEARAHAERAKARKIKLENAKLERLSDLTRRSDI